MGNNCRYKGFDSGIRGGIGGPYTTVPALNSNDKNDCNYGNTLTNDGRFKRLDIIALDVSSMTYPKVDAICQNSQQFAC